MKYQIYQKICKDKNKDFDINWINEYIMIYIRNIMKINYLFIIIENENEWKKIEKFIEWWMKKYK